MNICRNWIILRKSASEGSFELYTDVESAREHYVKIRSMFRAVLIVEVICLLMELAAWVGGFSAGFLCAVIIGALVLSLWKAIFKINGVIENLK